MSMWYVPPDRRLIWYEWEGEAVVFNAASGQTHYLNALSAEVLCRLEEAPQSVSGLVAILTEIMEGAQQDHLHWQISSLVTGFAELGVIDPCPT